MFSLEDHNGELGAVVVAAGSSERMGGMDKMRCKLLGKPVLSYSLATLEGCPLVKEVVLVVSKDNLPWSNILIKELDCKKVVAIIEGGERRQDSVKLGLSHISDSRWVLVHDGARPCIESGLVERGFETAQKTGAAVCAIPLNDTIKVVGGDFNIIRTLPSGDLWAAQTPQVFSRSILEEAHQKVLELVRDDSAMVENIGNAVSVFMGSYLNVKITIPEDIILAEAILGAR